MSAQNADRKTVYIGTRQSQLAMVQAKLVQGLLGEAYPDMTFELRAMSTRGDRVLDVSLQKIGGKSLFTKDLEDKLHAGWCDLIVHSLKDVSVQLAPQFILNGIMKREDPRDVVIISKTNVQKGIKSLNDLPDGSVIGTSSVRRVSQLRRNYPHLNILACRGNLNTRMKKLDGEYVPKQQEAIQAAFDKKFQIEHKGDEKAPVHASEIIPETPHYDAIVLAYAGVHRLGWDERISQVMNPEDLDNGMLYAVGQGCLGLECRADDKFIIDLCKVLCDDDSKIRAKAERGYMMGMDGNCSTPLAVKTVITRTPEGVPYLYIVGAIFSADGRLRYLQEETRIIRTDEEADKLGSDLALKVFGSIQKDYPQVQTVKEWLDLVKQD